VIFQTVGRSAGWLPAAAAAAKKNPRSAEDPPHIVLMPERAFEREKFLAAVKRAREQYGYVSIVCGEGVKYADGTPVSASRTRDKFANIEYGAMAGTSVAFQLHRMISEQFGWRGEFQVTESLCMCAIDRAVKRDLTEAYQCGVQAARLAAKGTTGVMVTLVRKSDSPYRCTTGTIPLAEVAVRAKPMPRDFINEAGNFPTRKFVDYVRPLVGELPEPGRLEYKRVGAPRKR